MKHSEAYILSDESQSGGYSNKPLRFLSASSILGDKVLSYNGDYLGRVMDIMIDLYAAKIEYIVLESESSPGVAGKYYVLPFPLLKMDPMREGFILNQSKEVFSGAPGFDKYHWPETNAELFDSTLNYWRGFVGVSADS